MVHIEAHGGRFGSIGWDIAVAVHIAHVVGWVVDISKGGAVGGGVSTGSLTRSLDGGVGSISYTLCTLLHLLLGMKIGDSYSSML